jgi:hypothetical protein
MRILRQALRALTVLTLTACGGNVSDSGPLAPPPPPPPPASTAITPIVGAQRTVGADQFGFNFNVMRADGQLQSSAFIHATRELRPGHLRIPGGTVGEYWSWSRGGIKPPPYPGLPEGSLFDAQIEAMSGLTPEVVDTFLDATASSALFGANVLTSTLSENISDFQRFQGLGQSIRRVELGNEEYFGYPNNRARFPDAAAYARLTREWTVELDTRFPGVRTAAIAPSPVRNVGSDFGDWMNALAAARAWDVVDAVAIHPYTDATMPVAVQDDASAAAFVARTVREDDTYIDRVLARLPSDKSIWITEWNSLDNSSSANVAGTWAHGLSALSRALNFLDTPRIEVMSFHVLLGDLQWQALTGLDGRFLDRANGRAVIGRVAPYEMTGAGMGLSLMGMAMDGGADIARLDLGFAEAQTTVFGYRFWKSGGRRLSLFVNGTDQPLVINVPGRARQLTAAPWSAATTSKVQQRLVTIPDTGLTLPAFSMTLVDEAGNSGLF